MYLKLHCGSIAEVISECTIMVSINTTILQVCCLACELLRYTQEHPCADLGARSHSVVFIALLDCFGRPRGMGCQTEGLVVCETS